MGDIVDVRLAYIDLVTDFRDRDKRIVGVEVDNTVSNQTDSINLRSEKLNLFLRSADLKQ